MAVKYTFFDRKDVLISYIYIYIYKCLCMKNAWTYPHTRSLLVVVQQEWDFWNFSIMKIIINCWNFSWVEMYDKKLNAFV